MIEYHTLHIRLHEGNGQYERYTRQLKNKLSVWDRYRYSAKYYLNDRSDVLIPRSVAPYLYAQYPGGVSYATESIIAAQILGVRIDSSYPPRDEIQRQTLEHLWQLHQQHSIVMMSIDMGRGKTYCTLNHASSLNVRVLVVCDRVKILEQWRDSCVKFYNVATDRLFEIVTGSNAILNCDRTVASDTRVVCTTNQTIDSAIKQDPKSFNRWAQHMGIGLLVIDEAHENFANVVRLLCHSDIARCVLLTGTPFRSNYRSNYAYQNTFYDAPKIEEAGRVDFNERQIEVVFAKWNSGIPGNEEDTMFKTAHGFNLVRYTNNWCISEASEHFQSALLNIIDMLYRDSNKQPTRTAIIFKTNAAVQWFYDIATRYLDTIEIGMFTSIISDNDQRNRELNKSIILSTDKSFGRAIDLPDLQVVINTIPFSSKTLSNQMVKRLRNNTNNERRIFVDMLDLSSKYCKRAYGYRRRQYEAFAKKFIEVKLT